MTAQTFDPAQAETPDFYERSASALSDNNLRNSFRGAMDFLVEKRAIQFDDQDELDRLRILGEQIKRRALSKLPDLLVQLEDQLTANGIQVHWAETTEEANRVIAELIKAENGKTVIKGKSMVTEEMELNHYLEGQGIECLESDMGEYIVQLAQQTPSHIIMPAIHQSKEDIARLFEKHLPDQKYTQNVDELITMARLELRKKFEEADIGISGVNFAVAETGTLCLVENEGNGRMTTTVPRVHIAVTGIEKVVENLADIPPLLSLLTRSATGQPITTYFNMISGPGTPGQMDGPEKVHLVLLDNGRSEAYQDQQFRKTLQCIRCGACMNHCPVYTRIGGHTYGSVYPGPIGKILTPHLKGLKDAVDLPSASSLCGACGEVCPVKIPIPDILHRWRKVAVAGDSRDSDVNQLISGSGVKRKQSEVVIWNLWSKLFTKPGLHKTFLWLSSRFGSLTPPWLGAWTKYRARPVPAKRNLHELVRNRTH